MGGRRALPHLALDRARAQQGVGHARGASGPRAAAPAPHPRRRVRQPRRARRAERRVPRALAALERACPSDRARAASRKVPDRVRAVPAERSVAAPDHAPGPRHAGRHAVLDRHRAPGTLSFSGVSPTCRRAPRASRRARTRARAHAHTRSIAAEAPEERASRAPERPKNSRRRATSRDRRPTVGAVSREIAANFTSAAADYFSRVAPNDAQYSSSELSCSWSPYGRHPGERSQRMSDC